MRPFELLAAVLGEGGARPARLLERLGKAEWAALADEASRHGVAPLLHDRLRAVRVPSAGAAPALQRLRSSHAVSALRAAVLARRLSAVLTALRDAGVDAIALKGAHLAADVYGDPALRPMVDLDLLVREPELGRAERALRRHGYARRADTDPDVDYSVLQHVPPLGKPGGPPVELHRSVVARHSPFRIDERGLWRRARCVEIAGVPTRVLGPEDLVLHLCIHASYVHRFEIPLLHLCDVAAALRRYRRSMDWSRLTAIAREDGRGRLVGATLHLVAITLGTALPATVAERLGPAEADRELLDLVRECMATAPRDLPVACRGLVEGDGFRAWSRALLRGVFPPPDRLARIYAVPPRSTAVYPYYLWRPFDLAVRRGRLVAGVLLRSRRLEPDLNRARKRSRVIRWVERAARPSARPPSVDGGGAGP